MTDRPTLEATGLVKEYARRRVVDGVDVVTRPGEVLGLVGPNGAGKTTLLRMFLGLARPDAGKVRILGSEVDGRAPLPARVGTVSDTPRFYPYLSGRRNLELLARLDGHARGSSPRALATAVDEHLDALGLAKDADRKAGGYSAGMRQRLGLAAALLRSPELLILDEPTAALDPVGVTDLRGLLRRLAQNGTTVVFSSHDIKEVLELCSTVTIMSLGKVVFSGTIAELYLRAPKGAHIMTTADDDRARSLAPPDEVEVLPGGDFPGFVVRGSQEALDRYVIALARADIAVRSLRTAVSPLESLFTELTSREAASARP